METKDPCASYFLSNSNFDLGLHVAGIFVILATSLTGTMLPFLFKRLFSTRGLVFQCSKIFGGGVLLATAWIHMQTAATSSLANPCLPQSFQSYPAFASLFAMLGMMFSHLVQVVSNQLMSTMVKQEEDIDSYHSHPNDHESGGNNTHEHEQHDHHHHHHQVIDKEKSSQFGQVDSASFATHDQSPLIINGLENRHPSCVEHDLHDVHDILGHEHLIDRFDHGHDHSHGGAIMHSGKISAYLLELGIASHSLLVGITLGSARDEFVTLLIALVFHQFFEGIAVSSVIIEANFHRKHQIAVMIAIFTLMMPIGMSIGIGIQASIADHATVSLISQGIMDALSAGILVYDGFVNVIIPHFTGKTYRKASAFIQTLHFLCLWAGAAVMAVIGIWA